MSQRNFSSRSAMGYRVCARTASDNQNFPRLSCCRASPRGDTRRASREGAIRSPGARSETSESIRPAKQCSSRDATARAQWRRASQDRPAFGVSGSSRRSRSDGVDSRLSRQQTLIGHAALNTHNDELLIRLDDDRLSDSVPAQASKPILLRNRERLEHLPHKALTSRPTLSPSGYHRLPIDTETTLPSAE